MGYEWAPTENPAMLVCQDCGAFVYARFRDQHSARHLHDGVACEHGCGLCDKPLVWTGTDPDGAEWWRCSDPECGNGHTSRDCCGPGPFDGSAGGAPSPPLLQQSGNG